MERGVWVCRYGGFLSLPGCCARVEKMTPHQRLAMNNPACIAGRQFALRHGSRFRNPYPAGSAEYNEFERGWTQAFRRCPEVIVRATGYAKFNGRSGNRTKSVKSGKRSEEHTSELQSR